MKTKSLALVAGVGILSATLSGCGSDQAVKSSDEKTANPATSDSSLANLSGKIAGAGASSQKSAADAWLAGFQSQAPQAVISYDPTGSGAGVTQFLEGAVAFAGTDEAIGGEEQEKSASACKKGKAFNVPVYVSPVAVAFNLDGVKKLNLKPETIAKIFKGEIKKWNHPEILATNEQVKLPNQEIIPVHRADKSGTTENFTDYLHQAAGKVWTDQPSKEWPISGGEAGDKTAGVVQALKAGKGTIGYLDASQAAEFGKVALQAGDGFVEYSAESAAKALDIAPQESGRDPHDLALKINRLPQDNGAYPLILVSYYVLCPEYKDGEQGKLVKHFVEFVTSAAGQDLAAGAAGSAPLSSQIRQKVKTAISQVK